MAHGARPKLLQLGVQIADFALPRLDGADTSLRDILSNGPALLAFFKVNCPVCQLTFPYLERLQTGGGLALYGISQNGPEDTRDFSRYFNISFPILLDSEAAGYAVSNTFGISTVPTLFLIEPGGSISQVSEGWHKKDIAELGARAGVNPFRPGDSVPEAKSG